MRLAEAQRIIHPGYVVSFERAVGATWVGDHFPDVKAGEPPIADEYEACRLAQRFAACAHLAGIRGVVVCRADNFKPLWSR